MSDFSFSLRDALDIAVVTVILYYIVILIRGTRGMQIAKGLVILLAAMFICRYLGLQTVNWLLQALLYGIMVALPIVFQPELRRMLINLGTGGGISTLTEQFRPHEESSAHIQAVDHIIWSLEQLSETKTGALMAIERETGLDEYCETGTMINADISAKLIYTLFNTKCPLHDGAVIIKNFRIVAASCYLPLSENVENKKSTGKKGYGTRHRAAIGLSEQTDAIVLVVSEETGKVSIAYNGRIISVKNLDVIKRFLLNVFHNSGHVPINIVMTEDSSEDAEVSETKPRT